MRAFARSTARARRGQAIIETALVLPLLLVLVFGIAEVSMFMYDYIQAANCTREAARRAAVRASNADSPDYCVSAALNPELTDGYETLPVGADVTAVIDIEYDWLVLDQLIPLIDDSPFGNWTIYAETTMRMEAQKVAAP